MPGCSKPSRTACSHCRLRPRRRGQRRVGAVGQVADARVPQRRHVHPDLVGAPGLQRDLQQAGRPVRLEGLVVGDARLAAGHDGPPVVVARVPVDRRVHGAAQRVRVALDQRVVGLVDRALLERALERGVGALGLGHDHQPAGADVQPVHDALALGRRRWWRSGSRRRPARRPRSARSSRGSGGRPPRPACRPRPGRRRRRPRPCRAPARRRPAARRAARGMVTSSQAPACTRSDLIAGAAVDQHVARADQLGRLGAGEAEQAGQRRVQPLAGEAVGHGQRTSVGHDVRSSQYR